MICIYPHFSGLLLSIKQGVAPYPMLAFINLRQLHIPFICLIFVSMFRLIFRRQQQVMPTMLMTRYSKISYIDKYYM